MRSSLAKVGLLDKSPVLPWIYKEMVNLEVSSIFFLWWFPRIQIKSVFFKWVMPSQQDTSKTALPNPMEQCSAHCLSKGAIVCWTFRFPGSKNTRRLTLLPETGALVYLWRQRQPASIRQLPCDFVQETPGDVQPVPGKQSFLLIPFIRVEWTEFLKLQCNKNNSPYMGLRRWTVPERWLGPCFLARYMA